VDLKAECGQLNLAHVTRNKSIKEETKTNRRQCPLSLVWDQWRQSKWLLCI